MKKKHRILLLGLIAIIGLSLIGCKEEEPEIIRQVGIQYDSTESTEEVIDKEEETEAPQEIETEKIGIGGSGLAGLEELQKEFDIVDTEKALSAKITDIPNYIANYIAQYYTKEKLVLDTYKVIYEDKMLITKPKDKEYYLLFSLSNYEDTSKAIVKISEIPYGKLYYYRDYLVSVKDKLVKGAIYLGQGTPSVRAEDIGAKSVLDLGEKLDFK